MINQLKQTLDNQCGKKSEGTLQNALAQLLISICSQNQDTLEIILNDLEVEEMSLDALAKHITKYAQENKVGNGFFMDTKKATKLVLDFYHVTSASHASSLLAQPKKETRKLNLSLEDLF